MYAQTHKQLHEQLCGYNDSVRGTSAKLVMRQKDLLQGEDMNIEEFEFKVEEVQGGDEESRII